MLQRERAQRDDRDRGRRTDAAALGDVAVQQQLGAALRPQAEFARQHHQRTEQVAGPAIAWIGAEQRPALLVVDRRTRQAEVAELHRQHLGARAVAARRPQPHQPVVAFLQRDAGGLGDRQLQHQRTGARGAAAEHVEPARRAHDPDLAVGAEERRHRLLDQPEQHQHAEPLGRVQGGTEVLHDAGLVTIAAAYDSRRAPPANWTPEPVSVFSPTCHGNRRPRVVPPAVRRCLQQRAGACALGQPAGRVGLPERRTHRQGRQPAAGVRFQPARPASACRRPTPTTCRRSSGSPRPRSNR